jgi:hypothetical protein
MTSNGQRLDRWQVHFDVVGCGAWTTGTPAARLTLRAARSTRGRGRSHPPYHAHRDRHRQREGGRRGRGSGGLFILAFPNDAAGALAIEVICAYSHQLLTFRVARRSRKRESNVRVVGRVVPARNE